MAHIFSLAIPAPPAYHEGSQSGDQVKFPDSGFFQGFNKPSRLEADIFELETTGTVRMLFDAQSLKLSASRSPKI
jgi:carotenoid cleavage dioxygenase